MNPEQRSTRQMLTGVGCLLGATVAAAVGMEPLTAALGGAAVAEYAEALATGVSDAEYRGRLGEAPARFR